jgi:hypothetical protein
MRVMPRHVVWFPTRAGWELEPLLDVPCETGGARSMHELAVCLAALGRAVEVRGAFSRTELERLGAAAGAMPELPTSSRPLDSNDVLLAPEGISDPLLWAHAVLSPARLIIVLLAPPGTVGWPFVADWHSRPVPAVDPDQVALPEHFRALAAAGAELWTNMPKIVELAAAAGVACAFIGDGSPVPYPTASRKLVDVAFLGHHRWADRARSVARQLDPSLTWRELPHAHNAEILRMLSESRVLIHPMGVEGHGRILHEARGVGTVPVTLNTNPYTVGADEQHGCVAVGSVDEMPDAIHELLREPARLAHLRARAMRSVREQTDWDRFLARVETALAAPRTHDDGRAARAMIGVRLRDYDAAMTGEAPAEVVAWRELRARLAALERERDELVAERDALVGERTRPVPASNWLSFCARSRASGRTRPWRRWLRRSSDARP